MSSPAPCRPCVLTCPVSPCPHLPRVPVSSPTPCPCVLTCPVSPCPHLAQLLPHLVTLFTCLPLITFLPIRFFAHL
ncbi:hypothetical protein E2C01_097724 [Portunus trituberculatus]|uniref:Uncharacterized protein n=1 Tax=Portunus trituberculatus TaxID=210409 RepID=A0A5B7K6H7_PORTR|nr:hypothetical protein [Portunus trituberculatus]